MGVEEEGEEEGAKRQRSSPPQVVPCRDFAPLTIAPPPSSVSTHPSSLTLSQLSPLHLPPVSSSSPSLYSSYNFPTSSSSGFPTSSPSLLSTFPTSSSSLPSTPLPWTLTPPHPPNPPALPLHLPHPSLPLPPNAPRRPNVSPEKTPPQALALPQPPTSPLALLPSLWPATH